MAKLIYTAITSLDGFTEDQHGEFRWSAPDDEVMAFVNQLERPIGTHLYGRRMYETMRYWETAGTGGESPAFGDFGQIWRAADKIVFSRTLEAPLTKRTRIEREFDRGAIEQLKRSAPHDISVGGPALAAEALAAGLVDECHLLLTPISVGAGKRALPAGLRLQLELVSERRFTAGVVHLHYRIAGGGRAAGS